MRAVTGFPPCCAKVAELIAAAARHVKAANGKLHKMVAAWATLPALLFREGEDGLVEGGVARKSRGMCLLLAASACSSVTLRTLQRRGPGRDGAEEGRTCRMVAVYAVRGVELARFGLKF